MDAVLQHNKVVTNYLEDVTVRRIICHVLTPLSALVSIFVIESILLILIVEQILMTDVQRVIVKTFSLVPKDFVPIEQTFVSLDLDMGNVIQMNISVEESVHSLILLLAFIFQAFAVCP